MSELETAKAASRMTAIRSTMTSGQAVKALAAEVLWKAPSGGGGGADLQKTPTASTPALDLNPPVTLGLRQGREAETDDGRECTAGRRLRLRR
jgi:hypothetical protein